VEDSGSSPSGVTGEPVDTSGLSFTATYDDGTTGSVVPSSYTPTSFGDTAGTQTVTFSFEGTDITVDVDYDVQSAATGFEVTGTLATQYQNRNVDTTGLSYTYNGEALDPGDVTVSPASWAAAGEGETITFTYDGNDVERTTDVLRTVASLPVTHTSSIPVGTARSADVDEIFQNVLSSELATGHLNGNWKFVLDMTDPQLAPVSLQAGDCVLWVQDKADYDLDQANGCDGTYVGTAIQLYGIDGSSLSFGAAPTASPGQEVATWTDFSMNMPMTGNGSATEDSEVCWVFAKAKANVADATTLKPSDVDLIAVWDVTYTV
jgi:hypothetical protein